MPSTVMPSSCITSMNPSEKSPRMPPPSRTNPRFMCFSRFLCFDVQRYKKLLTLILKLLTFSYLCKQKWKYEEGTVFHSVAACMCGSEGTGCVLFYRWKESLSQSGIGAWRWWCKGCCHGGCAEICGGVWCAN